MHASPSCQGTSCPSWPGTPPGGAYAVIEDRGANIKGGGEIFGLPISAAGRPGGTIAAGTKAGETGTTAVAGGGR